MTTTTDTDVDMGLTAGQKEGHRRIIDFCTMSHEERDGGMFCLKGYAGTGKTFLLRAVLDSLLALDGEKEDHVPATCIYLTAPTNPAVAQIRFALGDICTSYDNVSLCTTSSLLGLREEVGSDGKIRFVAKAWKKYGNGEPEYESISRITRGEECIVVVDETSMLNDYCFHLLKEYRDYARIIFIGDPAQIPPVGLDDCEPFLNPGEHGITEYTLTEIMRQKEGSMIVQNSFMVRNDLSADAYQFFYAPGGDIDIYSSLSQRDQVYSDISSTYTEMSVGYDTKVVAWRIKTVNSYNAYVRRLLFGDLAPRFVVGECMIMNGPCESDFLDSAMKVYGGDKKTREQQAKEQENFRPPMIHTNCQFIVTSIDVQRCTFLGGQYIYPCYVIGIVYDDLDGNNTHGRLLVLHEDAYEENRKDLSILYNRASESIDGKERARRFGYYHRVRRLTADVAYGYAITAHKAQGATYRKIYVDVRDISANWKKVERNRIIYTSITRARHKAVLIL